MDKFKCLRNKTKIIIPLIAVISLFTILFFMVDTFAFFKDKKVVVNEMKTGDIKVDIEEDFEKDPNINFDGKPIKKKVWIKNPSETDALIRVNITGRWVNPNDKTEIIPEKEGLVKLDFLEKFDESGNNTNWYKSNDGYYYYKHILRGKEKSIQLLDSITFNSNNDPIYEGKEYHVEVKAEAVQPTKHKEGEKTIYAYTEVWRNIQDKEVNTLLKSIVDEYDKE